VKSSDANNLPLAQPLTPRELEILKCIGDRLTNRQMAENLTIATGTVKWYVRQVYNKLGVSSRAEAVTRARGLGLLPAGDREGAVRHNLLAPATPFVGREAELDALAELIADPQVRIITLTGPGGIGKTRLALETAGRQIHPQTLFPDGIFFVSLAPIESAEEIVTALAAALDFHFQGPGNETKQLYNYLRNKQMLLVMDNFEHILDDRALLTNINEQAAQITLIVTSRERLLLRGEQLFPLDGLETVESEDSLTDSPAAQLFLHIAKRTVPDFHFHEGEAKQLIRICRLVEGMPLGLELAASWVGLLPLSEIAAEIEQGLTLLATMHHDVPQRHQSMQATLDVSWSRLNPRQRHAFQELTLFRGGFSRTAALKVAGAALPLLVTLINKSWLSYERQEDRYFIHELLRQYGAGKLSADPAWEQEARRKHSAFFCDYLHEREVDWFGLRQKEAAAEVRDEIDNIQTAWRWAAEQGNGVLLAQGLNSLCRFYLWEGRKTDGWHSCRLAGDGLSKQPTAQQADDAQRLALWSLALAWESDFVNEPAQKKELLARSQSTLDQVAPCDRDTRAEQAFIYQAKAYTAEYTDIDEAIRFASQGLALFRELGDLWSEAEALQVLGGYYDSRGEFDLANDLLRKSLEIRHQDDRLGIAETTVYLGYVATQQGNFEEAEALLRQSLYLFEQLEQLPGKLFCLGELSNTLSWAGKFVAAGESARQAIKIDRDLGQHPIPWRLNRFTMINIHLGHYAKAKATGIEGLEISRRDGLSGEIGLALMYLGNTTFVEGDFAEAKRCLLESATVWENLKHFLQALLDAILCYVLRAEGDEKMARNYLQSALRSGIESRYIPPIIYCLPAAALLAADDGHPRKAVELYGLAQQFGHIRNSRWFEDVACRELDEVRASLPPDIVYAAEARGREVDVWDTAGSLLRELDGRSNALEVSGEGD
jgi:DNA-binding CsgD family transcriptional regulator/tetratricopeptide (TPR) repeat protein